MSEALELEFRGEPRRPAGLRLLADERLARRAAAGDRAAFAVIFERHHQALHRYCRALLRHEEDARDALQNTFARALQALEGEERDIAVRPWLHRIAHNEAISLVRRRRPHRELDPEMEGATPGADAQAIAGERLRDLIADLEELPERQRSALLLRELNDLGYADVAAALGTTEQAARQAVYEARVMLAELEEGRQMPCDDVRVRISARDGRLLRPRRVRAHLRSCAGCRAFRDAIGTRRADLAAVAPPLAPAAAAALLQGLVGGGGGGTGGGLLAALGLGQGTSASAAGAKGVALMAAAATVGGGAVVVNQRVLPHPHRAPAATAPPARAGGPAARLAAPGAAGRPGGPVPAAAGRAPRAAAPGRHASGEAPPGAVHRPAVSRPGPEGTTAHPPALPHRPPAAADGVERAAPATAPAAPAGAPAGGGEAAGGARTPANSAGGNPQPGTPPAHSNAGGNGRGKAKGLAKPAGGGAAPAAAPAAGDPSAASGDTATAPAAGDAAGTPPASGAPAANGTGNNGKAKGKARQAAAGGS